MRLIYYVFQLNNLFYFTNKFEINSIPIMVQIICSGICGPILEELVFRGIVYNKLKDKKMEIERGFENNFKQEKRFIG